MKEQNNRDKLNDALGMVDEEMVQATCSTWRGCGLLTSPAAL